jgi:hypothetical protein
MKRTKNIESRKELATEMMDLYKKMKLFKLGLYLNKANDDYFLKAITLLGMLMATKSKNTRALKIYDRERDMYSFFDGMQRRKEIDTKIEEVKDMLSSCVMK